MYVLDKECVVFYDVDDTLVVYGDVPEGFTGPYVEIECNGFKRQYAVIQNAVDSIIEHKGRAHGVVVWSHGSVEWATAVVKALGLENLVDAVMAKPKWILDDVDPEKWMPKGRRVIKEGNGYVIREPS